MSRVTGRNVYTKNNSRIYNGDFIGKSGGRLIQKKFAIDFQWPVQEPFLFCVHHYDFYPRGNSDFGPEESLLKGRNIGQDFTLKDGFRMYHGSRVPGFPMHPHRGFETITIVRKGLVDHADSLGAAGRYGNGDVQWMTAGGGVQHSEMFPLLHADKENTLELFQIWLNLPKKSKMVPAHFKMFWSEKIPQLNMGDGVSIQLIAGEFNAVSALKPPPDSWAYDPQNEVGIFLIKMKAGTEWSLPKSKSEVRRSLYFFEGQGLYLENEQLSEHHAYFLSGDKELSFKSRDNVEFLILQAKPIGEPVVQYGPFVMNTQSEIIKTMEDYQATQFGGWPWPRADMVHGAKLERFARYPDGRIEKPLG